LPSDRLTYYRLIMKIFVITFILFVSGATFAQIAHVYSVDEGLAQGYVTALAKDKYGFLWVGTHNGLSRFDGIRFKNFKTGIGQGSIAFNKINQIIADASNEIWLTDGDQIQKINHEDYHFQTLDISSSKQYGDILGMAFDARGKLWVMRKRALFYLDVIRKNGTITANTLGVYPFQLTNFSPITMTLTHQKIIIGTDDGVFEYNISDGVLQKILDCPLQRVVQISEDHSFGGFWFHSHEGSALWKNGVFQFFPEVKTSAYLKCHLEQIAKHKKTYIVGIDKVFSWDGVTLRQEISGLPYDIISTLVDAQGNVWLGTNTQGLALYNTAPKSIVGFEIGKTIGDMVSKDGKGTIWNMESVKPPCSKVYAVNGTAQLEGKKYGIDETGHQWLLSCNNQLKNASLGTLFPLKNLNSQEPVQKMRCLKGHIIALVKTSGLILINTKTHREILLNDESIAPLLHRSNAFKQEADGTIWIGMDDGLLSVKADWVSGKATCQLYKKGEDLPNLEVLSLEIMDTPNKALLFGTLNGLYQFNIGQRQYTRFFNGEITRDEVVYCMQRDLKQRIWLGTNHGLKMYEPSTGKTNWFTVVDGLPASEFNRNTEFIAPDGVIFMGTVSGGVYFSPDSLCAAQTELKIAVSDVILNDTSVWTGNYNSIECQETDRISIHMTLLDFVLKPAHRYRYRLIGSSDEWKVTTNGVINFQWLSAGRYTFEICGTNGKSDWTLPLRIEIWVLMPFWKKIGIAVILLTILLLFGFLIRNWWVVPLNKVHRTNDSPLTLTTENDTGSEVAYGVIFLHQKVLELIEQHFKDSEFNVTTIQELLKISKVHLHRKMIEETGHTAAHFLKKRRMDEAENLIRNQPHMTISEIAYASGFSDPNYFSTVFSSYFGQSPRVFRQNLEKK